MCCTCADPDDTWCCSECRDVARAAAGLDPAADPRCPVHGPQTDRPYELVLDEDERHGR